MIPTTPPLAPSAEELSFQEEASLMKHFFDLDAAALSDVEGDQESDLTNGKDDSTPLASPVVLEFHSQHSRESSPLTPLTLSREPSIVWSNSERMVIPDFDDEAEQRRLQRSKSIPDGSHR